MTQLLVLVARSDCMILLLNGILYATEITKLGSSQYTYTPNISKQLENYWTLKIHKSLFNINCMQEF